MQKLPLGIQTFKEIIQGDYLYIDKTEMATNLVENNKYVFLSRPRRFGKSLFVSSLQELFEGNKELFKGLYAYDNWNWSENYPVIKIEFGGVKNSEVFEQVLHEKLEENTQRLKVSIKKHSQADLAFSELIRKASEKYNKKVVILVDEYDKPILDNLGKLNVATEIRDTLKHFYTQIKVNDQYIKFVFLTGVSKFSKMSLFSGLNNLTDISLNPKYGAICGYTQNDVECKFESYLSGVNLEDLKVWYNGYNFLGDKVYNPYDILSFINEGSVFDNYWFETGTPSFLIELIKTNNYFVPELDNLEVDKNFINNFNIEALSIETIMFQAGYLTIKEVIRKRERIAYKLCFPNKEVKNSFTDYLLNSFVSVTQKIRVADELYNILENGEPEKLEELFSKLFSSIAYNNFTNNYIENYEGFYASIVYAYLSSLGLHLIPEDVTNRGRVDLTVKTDTRTYLFEFKVNDVEPLQQIKEKKYYEKYSGEVFLIGIVFNPNERNIQKFEWEKV